MNPYREPASYVEPSIGWLHRLEHRLGWFYGTVETWYEGDRMMVGFRCSECGNVSGVKECPVDEVGFPILEDL